MFGFQARRQFQRAWKLKDRGDIEGARKAYERVLGSGVAGWGPNAGAQLGKMLMDHGDLGAARSAFDRAIAYRDTPLRPRPADPHARVPHASINWPFTAAVGLETVLERQGDHEGAQRAKALSYELARIKGNALLAGMTEPAQIELNRGHDFEFYGEISAAQRAYEKAESADHPKWSANAAYFLGRLLGNQGDVDGACAAYERAIAFGDPRLSASAKIRIEEMRSTTASSTSSTSGPTIAGKTVVVIPPLTRMSSQRERGEEPVAGACHFCGADDVLVDRLRDGADQIDEGFCASCWEQARALGGALAYSRPGEVWVACDPGTEDVVTPPQDPADPETHARLRTLGAQLREVAPAAARILSVRCNVFGGDTRSSAYASGDEAIDAIAQAVTQSLARGYEAQTYQVDSVGLAGGGTVMMHQTVGRTDGEWFEQMCYLVDTDHAIHRFYNYYR